ncbi:MAG: Gfo/Idh/MocA family oxidoreductase [Verrucomicrobiota bacterium]
MPTTPFRFVLVGSGNISRTYASAVANLEGVEIVGVVSRSGNRPDNLPPQVPVFDSLAAVTVDFESALLATPNGLHHEGAIAAAKLGKHVLTEKVLDISTDHMDAMINACDQAGVTLAVSFQRRMSPDNAAVKKRLDSGELGKVFAADMRVKFYRDMDYYNSGSYRGGYAIDGGGPFIQQAAHNVDIFCWFFGLPQKVISMLGTFVHPIETEDHGIAMFHYESGLIGSLTASTATRPGFPPVLEIHTDKGSIVMENDEITLWEIDGVENPSSRDDFEVHSGSASAAVTDTQGHEQIIRDFVNAIGDGRKPVAEAHSARKATDLVLQIYQNNQIA